MKFAIIYSALLIGAGIIGHEPSALPTVAVAWLVWGAYTLGKQES